MSLLAYKVHPGSGPALLLVHGFLSGPGQWHGNLTALGEVCQPVTVSLLGHGESPSPSSALAYQPEAYVGYFDEIRQEVGAEKLLLCGYSFGAGLTYRYVLAHPERVHAPKE